jgi:N-acetylglucosamine-6-phosphate deacetylase
VKAAVRAKGIGRSVLVTDAAAPSGCAPGRYRVGEIEVELTKDNRIVLAGEARLAASALSMDRGIENLMRLAGLTLGDAVRLATVNAARAGRLAGRQQGLAAGERADFTLFRFDPQSLSIRVEATYVGGERVFG